MKMHRTQNGSTLIEVMLFLSIVAIMSTAMVGTFISIQDARLRQQYMSEVEQRGAQLLGTMTKAIRGSEVILSPDAGTSSATLALQMSQNAVNPTIFLRTSSGNIMLIQKTSTAALLGQRVTVTGLQFINVANASVAVSFDMSVVLPTIPPRTYNEHFEGVATLTPKKASNGGCAACSVPVCSGGQEQWQYCDNGTCTASTVRVGC